MSSNNLVTLTFRVPQKTIDLIDQCGEKYGLNRSEIVRAGALAYCQQLLSIDSLQQINIACRTIVERTKNNEVVDFSSLTRLDQMATDYLKKLGIE